MQSPLITVLIDTHNYGHFIEQAIESVIAQDFPAAQLEILVIDDGSTDDTGERAKKYGSRIKYLTKTNAGNGSAFNLGFERASGEIVALLDAADYFLSQKLRRVVEQFKALPEAGVGAGIRSNHRGARNMATLLDEKRRSGAERRAKRCVALVAESCPAAANKTRV
jgi:glycosyltransferase involved in cell wall biosynthesis